MKINFNSKKLIAIFTLSGFNAIAQSPITEGNIPEKIDAITSIAKQNYNSKN